MANCEETQVVQQVLAGQTEAFRAIIQQHQGPILRFIGNVVMDHHHREDLAQEVFLAAYTNLASYDSSLASFSTWLFTIARNKSLNWLKKHRAATSGANMDGAVVSLRTPQADAMEQEFMRQFDAALSRLPLEQRTAFVLAEIEGCSYEQIAEIEQAPLGTVKSRINRAKQRLRSCLQPTMEGRSDVAR